MNLYKNGYVVSEVKDNDYTYNVWPFEDMYNDYIAMLLTEEADNNWFLKYDMQHIVPDFRFAYKYFRCCQEKGIKANILLYETSNSEIIVSDNNLPTKLLGFDCIGNVYYSYLKNEYNDFKEDLNAKGIYLNRYGLFKTLEDTLFYINIRRQDINNGIALEDFWEELPVRISLVIPEEQYIDDIDLLGTEWSFKNLKSLELYDVQIETLSDLSNEVDLERLKEHPNYDEAWMKD